MGHCNVCPTDVPDLELHDHFRDVHPDLWADLARWPDGAPVVHDATLAPADFQTANGADQ